METWRLHKALMVVLLLSIICLTEANVRTRDYSYYGQGWRFRWGCSSFRPYYNQHLLHHQGGVNAHYPSAGALLSQSTDDSSDNPPIVTIGSDWHRRRPSYCHYH